MLLGSQGRGVLTYPEWMYYPQRSRPPAWVAEFLQVVTAARASIDSRKVEGLNSNSDQARHTIGTQEARGRTDARCDTMLSVGRRRGISKPPAGIEPATY